jgi:lipopolysaccharide export system protein LptC
LKLNDHIVMVSSTGYEGRLSEATVNMSTGNVVSESPVEVKLLNGWLNAKRLEVLENGDLIRFGGGVEMTLTAEPAPAPTRTAPAPRGPLAP